jgi:hypothetical protein
VDISTADGKPCVLVVCHDLTDFKFRVEVEKDRQVAAKLQHEDKNTCVARDPPIAHPNSTPPRPHAHACTAVERSHAWR